MKIPEGALLIEGGLSNLVYRKGEFAYRKKLPSDPLFYDPLYEKKAYEAGSGILFPELIAFEENGDMENRYVEGGRQFLGPSASPDELRLFGKAIRSFHGLKIEGDQRGFRGIERLTAYKELSGVPALNEEKEKAAIEAYRKLLEGPLVPCHNDLVSGNALLKGGRIYLLDLEFAGLNTPYFDLASALSENGITDGDSQRALLEGYFGTNANIEKELDKVLSIVPFLDALWHCWALYRYKETGKPDFFEIAKHKFSSFASF